MKKLSILGVILLALNLQSYGQSGTLSDATTIANLALTECSIADTFYIDIENTSAVNTLTGVSFTDTFPANIAYIGFVPNAAVASVDVTDPTIPIFNLNDIAASTTVTVGVLVMAECNANSAASSYINGYQLAYTESGSSYTSDEVSLDYISGIKRANLQLQDIGTNDFPLAKFGDTMCRNYRIQNTGVQSFLDSFWLAIDYQPGLTHLSLKVNGVTVTPTVTATGIEFQDTANLRNVGVFPTDFIEIEDCFIFESCLSGAATSDVTAWWGCGGAVCQDRTRTPAVQHSSGVPNFNVSTTIGRGCHNGYDTIRVEMINVGNEAATNVIANVVTRVSTSTTVSTNTMTYLDTSSLSIQYGENGTKTSVAPENVTYKTFNRSFWPATLPPHSSDINIGTVEAGDTVIFCYRIFKPCLDESTCASTQYHSSNFEVVYNKACSPAIYRENRQEVSRQTIRGQNYVDGPTDMGDGDTMAFRFGVGSSAYENFAIDSNGYYYFELELPAGLCWDFDTSSIQLQSLAANGIQFPDSLTYDPTLTNTLKLWFGFFDDANSRTVAYSYLRNYFININMVLDCSKPGATGGANSAKMRTYINPMGDCATCEMPYGCEAVWTYNAHCPGPCPDGGFLAKKALIERVNFGAPDNDQDGLPDAAGALDMSIVEWAKVAPKDTFNLYYMGTVVRGVSSPAQFDYGYGEVIIPNIGNLVDTTEGTTIQIWDASAGTNFTLTNVPATYSTSAGERTFLFDYSPTGGAAGFPAGYFFDAGDSIVVNARFVYDNTNIATAEYISAVENEFYLSDIADPALEADKYACDAWNGKLYSVPEFNTRATNGTLTYSNCDNRIWYYYAYQSIGIASANYYTSIHFPKEYRNYGIQDSLRIQIPQGWQVDSANILMRHGERVGNARNTYLYGLTPSRISGDTLVYDIQQHYTINGGSVVPSRGGWRNDFRLYVKPTCELTSGLRYDKVVDFFMSGKNTHENCDFQDLDYGPHGAIYNSPVLGVTSFGSVSSDGETRDVCWDIKLQNDAVSTDANFSWISWGTPDGSITVDSITDLGSGTLLSSNNEVYEAGTIQSGGTPSSRQFRVCAQYNHCGPDTLWIYTGWDCAGYPDSMGSYPCNIDSVPLILNPLYPVLQTNTVSTASSIDMCGEGEFIISTSQRDVAAAYENWMDVILPAGMEIVDDSSYVEYLGDGSITYFDHIALGDTARFMVSDSTPIDGLSVFANAPENEYHLRIKLRPTCDFVSGSSVRFIANGVAPCGDTLSPASEFHPVTITGSPGEYDYQARITNDTLDACGSSITLDAAFVNLHTSATTTNDSFTVELPAGVSYVPSSTSFSSNAFVPTEPIETTVGGITTLTWAVGTAVPTNDSSEWTFDITLDDDNMCGEISYTAGIKSAYTMPCGMITCNSVASVNENMAVSELARPNIQITSNDITIIHDTLTGAIDTMFVNIGLENIGLADLSATEMEINIIRDIDNDGTVSPGDSMLTTDANLNTIAADGGTAMATFTNTGLNGIYDCPVIIQLVPDCNCGSDTIEQMANCNVQAVPVELTYFEVQNIDNINALLTWQTATEINNHKFVVQRQTASDLKFEDVGEVLGAGNSITLTDYQLVDNIEQAVEGTILYRLKQIDFDKEVTYSDIRRIEKGGVSTVVVHPNPATNEVRINADFEGFKYSIIDALGQLISEGSSKTDVAIIDLSSMSNGIYHVNVTDDFTNETQSTKLTIIR